MAEGFPALRYLNSGSSSPVSVGSRPRKFLLFILFASLLGSCIGHEREVAQSFFDPRPPAEWVLMNAKVVTVDSSFSIKEAVAIKNGRFVAVGTDGEMRRWIGRNTAVVNLGGRTMIPGLIDSHIHATAAGLSWDGELHWESVRSLADGLKQIEAAARNKPPGTWIVVGGGWVPGQFAEKRLPTRAELDAIAPKHPVYIQYLRQAAVLNRPVWLRLELIVKRRRYALQNARWLTAEAGYNFHLHTTQDNTARQLLTVIEEVNRETPFARQRIAFAHLEDATPETIARIKKLGGGVSVQDRMVLTGERNVELWGQSKARNAPPLRTLIDSGMPLGAGTDAFRSGNYSPMLSLWWLITGKTVAGAPIRDPKQNVTRAEALRMYTMGSAWFTFAEKRKGSIEAGKLADLAVLNADYLTVPEDQIRSIESVLTMVGGRVVYTASPFTGLQR
jgi:predicted amidohydrolase YtcJ